ncbi:hypothetical protein Ocin01_12507 [Orchesella cincta]|uniref:Uncharacterized protein n=1 Tax=Orchesella cincta TaxID=48709 RepID=A0A1D2MMN1_ORCCI|nr:hypothetical protein Ocin01_12507 [Orchesella cincta]
MSSTKFPVFSHDSESSNVSVAEKDSGNSLKRSESSSPIDADGDPLLNFYQRLVPPHVRVFKREHPERHPNETEEEYQFRWAFYEYAKLHPLTSPSYFYDIEVQDILPLPVIETSSSDFTITPPENDDEPLPLPEPEFVADINNSVPNLHEDLLQCKLNQEDFKNENVKSLNEDKLENYCNILTEWSFKLNADNNDDEKPLKRSALKKKHSLANVGLENNEIKRTKFKVFSPPSQQSSMSCIISTTFPDLSTSYSSPKLTNKRPSSSRTRSRSKRSKKSFEEMFHRPTSVPSQTWYENVALRKELTNRYTFVSPSVSSRKLCAPPLPLTTSKSHQKLIIERLHSGKPTSAKSSKKMERSRSTRFL